MTGKRIGRSLYIGIGAILTGQSRLRPAHVQQIKHGRLWLPSDFRLDIVCLEPKHKIRYIELNSLTVPHPHATRSYVVDLSDVGPMAPGVCRGQLYHRLDLILHPEHPQYNFHRAVTEFEEQTGLLGPGQPHAIGLPRVWWNWVAHHMSLDDYEAKITELKERWL